MNNISSLSLDICVLQMMTCLCKPIFHILKMLFLTKQVSLVEHSLQSGTETENKKSVGDSAGNYFIQSGSFSWFIMTISSVSPTSPASTIIWIVLVLVRPVQTRAYYQQRCPLQGHFLQLTDFLMISTFDLFCLYPPRENLANSHSNWWRDDPGVETESFLTRCNGHVFCNLT